MTVAIYTRLSPKPGGVSAGHIIMGDPEGNEFCLD